LKIFGFTPHYPQFFTATILEWKHLLKPDKYKDIITESLSFRVKEKQIFVYGFVIMPNHIHIICQVREGYSESKWSFLYILIAHVVGAVMPKARRTTNNGIIQEPNCNNLWKQPRRSKND
jgi:hypothetical protein